LYQKAASRYAYSMETSNPAQNEDRTTFLKIISREIPAEIVYEDEHTLAFLSIHPNHAGHTLVIPKKYARNLFDMDAITLSHLMETVQKVVAAVQKATDCGGINLAMNNEAVAGQVIFHAHVHVIPRFAGDGFKFFPPTTYAPGEAAATAEKIRASFPSAQAH
jgi:histidine triad (HIT) family protein